MIVTFCGHAQLDDSRRVSSWLNEVLERLMSEGADTFYLGGRGEFDMLAARSVCALRQAHPAIRVILVQAYLSETADSQIYDGALYPDLENTPPRYSIVRRNRWMVDASDVVVACVTHEWGGAAGTRDYARRRGKRIIEF